MNLAWLMKDWLERGDGPSCLDCIVLDRCTRALKGGARHYVAQQGPQNLNIQIALLENQMVMTEMLGPGMTTREAAPKRTIPLVLRSTPAQSDDGASAVDGWDTCCHDCSGEVVQMATATPGSEEPRRCHYLTTCWAHEGTAPPKIPVKVTGQDTVATLDSGRAITLVRRKSGPSIDVACVHRETRQYPTTTVKLIVPRGGYTLQVGGFAGLPVPM